MTMRRVLALTLIVFVWAQVALGAASYPTTVKSFVTKSTGDIIQAAHINDLQDEVAAVETGLLSGLQHHLRPLASITQDLGIASALWRDLNLGRTINFTQGTITANNPFLNGTTTWNNGAVTFIGTFFNITDTASAAASLLMQYQIGSVDRLTLRKDGLLSLGGAGAGINLTAGAAVRIGTTDAFDLILKRNNVDQMSFTSTSINLVAQDIVSLKGAAASWGTADNFDFVLRRNNVTKMTLGSTLAVFADKLVSIGLTSPTGSDLDLQRDSVGKLNLATSLATFTTPVVLPADPTTALQAATKQYVDVAVGLLDRNNTDVTVENTTTETSIYSFSIPANKLGATGGVRLTINGTAANNNLTNQLTVRIKLGATTVVTIGPTNNNSTAGTQFPATISMDLFNTATGAQRAMAWLRWLIDPSSPVQHAGFYGTAAEDTTAARTLDVTVQWATASVNNSFRKKMAYLEFFP